MTTSSMVWRPTAGWYLADSEGQPDRQASAGVLPASFAVGETPIGSVPGDRVVRYWDGRAWAADVALEADQPQWPAPGLIGLARRLPTGPATEQLPDIASTLPLPVLR